MHRPPWEFCEQDGGRWLKEGDRNWACLWLHGLSGSVVQNNVKGREAVHVCTVLVYQGRPSLTPQKVWLDRLAHRKADGYTCTWDRVPRGSLCHCTFHTFPSSFFFRLCLPFFLPPSSKHTVCTYLHYIAGDNVRSGKKPVSYLFLWLKHWS